LDPHISRDPSDLNISDLAQDSSFIHWVRDEDPEADAYWSAWLLNHPETENKIEAARSLVRALQFKEEGMSSHQIHAEWSKVNTTISYQAETKVRKVDWFRRKGYLSLAAAILVLLMFAPFAYLLIEKQSNATPEVEFITRTTSPGQKLSITLSDGTKIKLNSDSELKYPTQFTSDRREVTLKGEAFFDVAHNDRVPFNVHSAGITVVVLGTSFNVSAYPENTDVKIALEEGRVKIKMTGDQHGHADIFLTPNEMIEINKSSFSHDIQTFNPSETTSWKDGCLYLGKADFNETVLKLERWFGVKFQIDKRFKSNPDWRFIGKFQDKSLPYVLNALSYPDLFKYRIEAQKVIVY
jgi:transmembrane sensor